MWGGVKLQHEVVDGKIAVLAQLSGEGGLLGELVTVREDAAGTSRGVAHLSRDSLLMGYLGKPLKNPFFKGFSKQPYPAENHTT